MVEKCGLQSSWDVDSPRVNVLGARPDEYAEILLSLGRVLESSRCWDSSRLGDGLFSRESVTMCQIPLFTKCVFGERVALGHTRFDDSGLEELRTVNRKPSTPDQTATLPNGLLCPLPEGRPVKLKGLE